MAITLAVGTQIAIASTYGASKAMSVLSNAAEAVATLEASHGVIENDILELTSGWDLLNGRIVRADSVATNDVTLENINTASTTRYPAGSGTGSVREITAWTQITQITEDFGAGGGGQNYANITTLADRVRKQIPTDREPVTVQIPFYYDPSLAWYSVVAAISEASDLAAVRFSFSDGSVLYGNAYWSLQQIPTVQDKTLRGAIDLSFFSLPTFYAS